MPPEIVAGLESSQVVRVGRVLDTAAPYYRAMDIYLHLSRYEGLPNAVLEAGASGLPVVTTDATGCRDAMSNGMTGYIVPIGDVDGLTAGLETLCTSDTSVARWVKPAAVSLPHRSLTRSFGAICCAT